MTKKTRDLLIIVISLVLIGSCIHNCQTASEQAEREERENRRAAQKAKDDAQKARNENRTALTNEIHELYVLCKKTGGRHILDQKGGYEEMLRKGLSTYKDCLYKGEEIAFRQAMVVVADDCWWSLYKESRNSEGISLAYEIRNQYSEKYQKELNDIELKKLLSD